MAPSNARYKKIVIGGSIALTIITVIIIFMPSLIFIPKHRVDVEIVQSGLTIKFIKIKVANTGSERLTNVIVSFGLDEKQNLRTLDAGNSVWLTPKNKLPPFVTVTSDEGVSVMKNIDTNLPYLKTDSP